MDKVNNRKRLVGLIRLFGIPVVRVAQVTGKSRSFVSRIVNGDDRLGSDSFYRQLEMHLPEIIAHRTRSYFALQGTSVDEVHGLIP